MTQIYKTVATHASAVGTTVPAARFRYVALVVSAALVVASAVLLLVAGGADPAKDVADYCRSAQAVRRYTPVSLGGATKLLFYLDGGTMYARADSYSTVVAVVVGERVDVVDRDLWEAFFAYCVATYSAEYEREVVARLSLALLAGLALALAGLALLVGSYAKRR